MMEARGAAAQIRSGLSLPLNVEIEAITSPS